MALPDSRKYDSVDGELIQMRPAGARQGRIVADLLIRLGSPDVSFVAGTRLTGGVPEGFLHVAPDLALEVLSPSDLAGMMAQKVGECLGVGVRLTWIIDPARLSAVVYRPGATPRTVRQDGALDGEDVLPGFSCPLRELLG